ncbi:MAG: putative bifunctional diguanylate cyclase/phosphodiesterase [Gammaproteobacteria bacterium]
MDIDLTERKRDEEKIRNLAFYDPLTHLPNRRLLMERLQQAIAECNRSTQYGAILFFDLDNFKALNDTLGHDKGDQLLEQVAIRLDHCIREVDTVARLGGDEFVVLLKNLSKNRQEAPFQAETVCEKILVTLNKPYQLAGIEYHNTASIGVVIFGDHFISVEELVKRADIAMYQAKQAGCNTFRFFDPEMQSVVEKRLGLEHALRKALPENQLLLYYQIQVDDIGGIQGAEVLLRWKHPDMGLISPVDFIPLAEDTGLIVPIGLWVLENACSHLKRWEKYPNKRHLQLAVNVSARQFKQSDFNQQIANILLRTGADPSRLKLELTESLVLDNVKDTIDKMKKLKQLGVQFSMDDFGTGYSSLSSLKKLPIDQLKIDQSFVRNIDTDPDDAIIVQTIIAMANNLGMAVIAEGVETERQKTFLIQHNCRQFQGYLFGRPVPIEQFELLFG